MSNQDDDPASQSAHQPIFLIPGVILSLVGLMVAVHLASTLVLNDRGRLDLVTWLGFIPYRLVEPSEFPGGLVPLIWSPLTYALLHGSWEHLLGNMAWLVIFGTPVARRYGVLPTLAIFIITSIIGALAFGLSELDGPAYLIGASGGVAGFTGAAIRFMFQPTIVARHPETGELVPLGRRLATVREVAHTPPARNLALLWIVLNCFVPILPVVIGQQVAIAWQAHLGGFFAGFYAVQLFDKSYRLPLPPNGGEDPTAE